MYVLWKAPRETFKVSLWTPLASGAKLPVPPPTGLFLCSKQLPELLLHGACFLLWLFFEATWHFSIAATRENVSRIFFFPPFAPSNPVVGKLSVLSTLFFPHLTSPFQSWGEVDLALFTTKAALTQSHLSVEVSNKSLTDRPQTEHTSPCSLPKCTTGVPSTLGSPHCPLWKGATKQGGQAHLCPLG